MESVVNAAAQSALVLPEFAANLNLYILAPICTAVLIFFVSYIRNYQRPAEEISFHLSDIVSKIRQVRSEESSKTIIFQKINELFENSPFRYLWAEYRQTLHTVDAKAEMGIEKEVHATVPAEAFFSKESIVDLQINADFYRHLPGILTGIGIIGTFSGLVWGLHEFKPSPGEAVESLPFLLREVTSAFLGSGFAILAAIFITYKEKDILSECYRSVEVLNKEIDSLHNMGAEEAYLARMVRASEETSLDMKVVKGTLSQVLSQAMQDIADKQMFAQRQQAEMMSEQLSNAIRTALEEPMVKLSGAMRVATKGQQDAVGGLLQDLLSGFMSKLDQTFGAQMRDMNVAMQQSSSAMSKVQDTMTGSIYEISNAGRSATDMIATRLEDSLSKMAKMQTDVSNQVIQQQQRSSELMDASMGSVLARLQETLDTLALERRQQMDLVTQQQLQSSEMMDNSMKAVLIRLQDALESMSYEREKQMEEEKLRHDNMTISVKELHESLTSSVKDVSVDLRETTAKTNESLEIMQKTAIHAITGMKDGAGMMKEAAERFTIAGQSMTGVTETMSETARTLGVTADVMSTSFESYESTHQSVQQYVAQLQGLVETMNKESGVNQQIVDDMERIVNSLAGAERQSKEQMDRVNDVLKQAFRDFGLEMVGQVRNISAESNRQLGSSLHVLSGTVDTMVASVSKMRRAG